MFTFCTQKYLHAVLQLYLKTYISLYLQSVCSGGKCYIKLHLHVPVPTYLTVCGKVASVVCFGMVASSVWYGGMVASAAICSFLRGAAGGGFGRPWPRHKLLRCSRRGGLLEETRAEEGGTPPPFSSLPSSSPPPSPPSLLVVGQHIRVRSHGRRSVQPCEGCQGYYGDVYWGRGISQLALILYCSVLLLISRVHLPEGKENHIY